MTQRTFNIIRACKHPRDNMERLVDSVKQYMSEECDCPLEHYTDNRMNGIMFEAMCDYIDTCDKPSVFLRQIENIYDKEKYNYAELIAIAFQLVQVKDNERQYINGFTADMWN